MDTIEIYRGERGEPFKNLIRSILKHGNIKPKFVEAIFTEDNMRILDAAFTHQSANPRRNYQFLEILGDSTANDTLVWYFSRRFPQINCPDGVNTLARLKINYGSKKMFSKFAAKLGMWPFITASEEVRKNAYSKTLEDVFEAFIGAIKKILDATFMIGVGNAVIYDFIAGFMNTVDISLRYEDLYDPKTRLQDTILWYLKENKEKQWYQNHQKKFKANPKLAQNWLSFYLEYFSNKENDRYYNTRVMIKDLEAFNFRSEVIGSGKNFVKVDSEQEAAEQGLAWLKRRGISKPIPEFYTTYCNFEPGEYMV